MGNVPFSLDDEPEDLKAQAHVSVLNKYTNVQETGLDIIEEASESATVLDSRRESYMSMHNVPTFPEEDREGRESYFGQRRYIGSVFSVKRPTMTDNAKEDIRS